MAGDPPALQLAAPAERRILSRTDPRLCLGKYTALLSSQERKALFTCYFLQIPHDFYC